MRTARWGVVGVAAAAAVAARNRRPRHRDGPGLSILHLAFEDHLRPGSGGGGVRTHEIDRRLAARGHRVVVVTTNYRGARRRVEDGVEYRPLGLPWGYFASIVSYHLLTPLVVLCTRPDLVVEDFAAPMSSVLVPLWTSRPTIAVVQWLFAAETSQRYRVPFYVAEDLGVRLHRRFVAVSGYIGEQIQRRNPEATIDVVPAGVEAPAGDAPEAGGRPPRLLYLGRLQPEAKGLDLLVDAFARLAGEHPGVRLTIAGDGPERPRLEALGVPGVELVGRVEGEGKWRLLREADVVVVPSRFESFGLVVLEAFAAGTPVVAFDLPALRELVTPDCGTLVPCFDVDDFAKALGEILDDPERAARMGQDARRRAEAYSWDAAASAQERAYLAAAAARR